MLTGLKTPVRSARELATGEKLKIIPGPDGALLIEKPAIVDPLSTTVELKLAAPPVVEEVEVRLSPNSGGVLTLAATDAELEGDTIKLENQNLGYWIDAKDAAHWKVAIPADGAGKYSVKMEVACEPGNEGSTFTLQIDGKNSGVTGTIEKTASWNDYHTISLDGALELTAGPHTIRIVPLTKPGGAVMNLRSISLLKTG
jgi:hypothetical protein